MITIETKVDIHNAEQLLEMAHTLAHLDGGCDERPLLLFAYAIKELGDVTQGFPRAERLQLAREFIQTVTFAAAGFLDNFFDQYKDRLPKELQERVEALKAQTTH